MTQSCRRDRSIVQLQPGWVCYFGQLTSPRKASEKSTFKCALIERIVVSNSWKTPCDLPRTLQLIIEGLKRWLMGESLQGRGGSQLPITSNRMKLLKASFLLPFSLIPISPQVWIQTEPFSNLKSLTDYSTLSICGNTCTFLSRELTNQGVSSVWSMFLYYLFL